MNAGVKSTDLEPASLLTEFIGNLQGSTKSAPVNAVAAQMLATGPIADRMAQLVEQLNGNLKGYYDDIAGLNAEPGEDRDLGAVLSGLQAGMYRHDGTAWTKISDLPPGWQASEVRPEDIAEVQKSALGAYVGALWSFVGVLAGTGMVPAAVGADNHVLSYVADEVVTLEQYKAGLWQFTGRVADASKAPVVVGGDNRVLEYKLSGTDPMQAYQAGLWSFTGWAEDLDRAPSLVGMNNRVIGLAGRQPVPEFETYIAGGALRAIGGAQKDREVNNDPGRNWLGARAVDGRIRGVSEVDGQRALLSVSPETGNVFLDEVIRVFLGVGQSNGRGSQSGAAEVELLRTAYPYPGNMLMLGGSVWANTVSDNSFVLDPETITGWAPLTGTLDGAYANTAAESAALRYANASDDQCSGWVGQTAVMNLAVGGQSIERLSQNPPNGETCWDNLVKAITRAEEVKPEGAQLVVPWLQMHQGESGTGDVLLGSKHDQYRADIEAVVQATFGQTDPVRMISWQPASYQTSNAARSILTHYLSVRAARGTFWCGGPSYGFPFADQFLHHSALGHDMRGEFDAAIMQEVERTGFYDPLHMVAASVTGANEITVTLNMAASIVTDDDVVAPVTHAGIEVPGLTVTGVQVNGSDLVITTAEPAAGAVKVEAALQSQTNPRTAAAIPRTNIRADAMLGSYRAGGHIARWLCAQDIILT